MTEPILVTGATGFIGSYVLQDLLREDREVRVLVRSPEKLSPQARGRIKVFVGDLSQPSSDEAIEAAADGVGTILHLAALARAWSPRADEFHAMNVRLVERILAAAVANDVSRFVHVSTILTLPPFRTADVDGAAAQPTIYETTKREGELLVEEYAASGRHAVIVHPTRVFGPGPLNDANATAKVAALYLKGRFRVRLADNDVEANYVHVADVARGVILAAEKGRSGVHYVLGGENHSFRHFLDLVGEIGGRRRTVVSLPAPVALSAAWASELLGKIGGTTSITRGWIRVFLEDRRADIEPARRDLGYAPRPLRQILEETIGWLKATDQ